MSDVKLYCGDCLEILLTLEVGSVDAVVTDPPYCSGAHESAKRSKRNGITPESIKERLVIDSDSMGSLGFEWITRRWFLDIRKLVNNGGHILCFTDWRMYPQVSILLEAAGWRLNNMIVWDKGYPGLGSGFRAQHEVVIAGSNGPPDWHSYDYGNVIKSMRLTNTDHPHQKPIDLLLAIIETCTQVGDTILDPFMGSGTTGMACVQTGRNFIGIEIDPTYYAIAEKRIKEAQMQLRMVV